VGHHPSVLQPLGVDAKVSGLEGNAGRQFPLLHAARGSQRVVAAVSRRDSALKRLVGAFKKKLLQMPHMEEQADDGVQQLPHPMQVGHVGITPKGRGVLAEAGGAREPA